MNFIDLFAGVGGFHLGLERNGFKCVWANEWNKYAGEIYKKRFSNTPFFGEDLRKVKVSEIPDHDLLVGGFPCQAFSIAGKRRGFEETRGTLFFEIARIAQEKRPRLLLLENVKGLLSHNEGRTFAIILNTLDEIGYDAEWEVLNSKNFGVPQNRERVFIIGHLRGESESKVFPLGVNDYKYASSSEKKQRGRKGIWLPNYTGALRVKESKSGCDTVIKEGETRIRRLTPTEYERLQGFPAGWTEGLADTQRYKCMGNAVTVNVVQAIGEKLLGAES